MRCFDCVYVLIVLLLPLAIRSQNITYTFNGNGNWNLSSNWANHLVPPAVLHPGSSIIIACPAGDSCLLPQQQIIAPGASMIVNTGSNLVVKGNLILQPGNLPLPNTVDFTDTLKVMGYNILNYGDGCQGDTSVLNGYFKTIIQYTLPDIFSCEKLNVFNVTSTGSSNLAIAIRNNVLNAVMPGQYEYVTPTNISGDNKINVFFYNKKKLGYLNTQNLVANVSDFNLYKLYYLDPNLAITKDTTFIYVVCNHTQSGNSSTTRDQQITQEMQALRTKFSHFPNLINLGDFNTRNSDEGCYQVIINSSDSSTKMYDPPFYPDGPLQYPADWDNNPSDFKNFLTTSTRQSSSVPNSCGTNGGGKSWYDHIFLSPWIIRDSNYVSYLPHSYSTIGNDGNRVGVSINSTSPVNNNSAPASVINALFQFSNKYPVILKLKVRANRSGNSPAE